uniref:Uncharacterized protein n=1 Tax=Setaria italica TaxID=4555 RepID=K3YAP4_SETIT
MVHVGFARRRWALSSRGSSRQKGMPSAPGAWRACVPRDGRRRLNWRRVAIRLDREGERDTGRGQLGIQVDSVHTRSSSLLSHLPNIAVATLHGLCLFCACKHIDPFWPNDPRAVLVRGTSNCPDEGTPEEELLTC